MLKQYETEDIQVLDYPENIQRRPGMYVGGTGLDALHHLAYELIDNAVDEALAGACSQIGVEIQSDGSLTVTDDGRGIPTGMHAEKERPTLELVFTGRGADPRLVERADLVTEMREVKHYYREGVLARKGIES